MTSLIAVCRCTLTDLASLELSENAVQKPIENEILLVGQMHSHARLLLCLTRSIYGAARLAPQPRRGGQTLN